MAGLFDQALDGMVSATKFAPDRFRASAMSQMGMASPSRFEVDFPSIKGMTSVSGEKIKDPTNSEDRSIFCTAAGMPGKQIETTNKGIGFENQLLATGHSMPEVNFSFYLTNTYVMREYFELWMRCITSQDQGEAQYAGYYDNYIKDVSITQYTRNARRAYGVKLVNAYPTGISTIEFNNQLQSAVAEITVTMTYRTYETDKKKESAIDIIEGIF